ARQITYACTKNIDSTLAEASMSILETAFFNIVDLIKEGSCTPYLMLSPLGEPVEYSYAPLEFYGDGSKIEKCDSFSVAIDAFYEKKSRNERIRQKSSDILRLLTNAQNRVTRKISLQSEELLNCAKSEDLKLFGDLITANIYLMKRGQERISVVNYYDDACPMVEISLDSRLSPAQNAQRYYKKYSKAKTAKIELTKQIELARQELEYIETVFEALSKAETESDLVEIRDELYHSGYASRMKNYSVGKAQTPKPLKFTTTNGYTVLCGKNNKQNDYITTKLATKTDWWFHVKNLPGSHVLMQTDGEEPPEVDFTEAAEIAAFYSKAQGNNIAVDYTPAKNVKKPSGSKPGYVIYHINWTAYVSPDEQKINRMQEK
ncbi:MAG: NFACT family protein, partial [Clostridia bacterium]|nr:NFACT family protein [Clostridia bacterium]